MQPPNPDHIELEIQYPQYKIVLITIVMTICGILGTFYVFFRRKRDQLQKRSSNRETTSNHRYAKSHSKIQHRTI